MRHEGIPVARERLRILRLWDALRRPWAIR